MLILILRIGNRQFSKIDDLMAQIEVEIYTNFAEKTMVPCRLLPLA